MYKVYNVLAIILLQVPFMSATDCISCMIEYGMTHTSNRQYVFNLVLTNIGEKGELKLKVAYNVFHQIFLYYVKLNYIFTLMFYF